MHLRLPRCGVTSVEGQASVELYEPQEMQRIMRGEFLLSSPRIRMVPQFPHLHSTVGLSASSTGGALGTASMTSGAGTILNVFCRRAGMLPPVPNSELNVTCTSVKVPNFLIVKPKIWPGTRW